MCGVNLGDTLSNAIDPGHLFTKDSSQPATPAPTAPTPPPQKSKAPTAAQFRDANSATENTQGGTPSTLLTGPTGVDPNALQLGKNTLLGS
ncbi:hypothetical protein CAL26_09940 [Bordetella genomosp. 9]|uniref:Uncharacterized protein n=1 Tax=Bordetella genomosp. 9 TaxID=1416803 RepID=A0A261RFN5_9BORD|nr:hypothetical protein [Bordetella genomosp. 9]OZI23741.1 hypothetical protein CAL26_09940 [Bordetella genomosp. 9]